MLSRDMTPRTSIGMLIVIAVFAIGAWIFFGTKISSPIPAGNPTATSTEPGVLNGKTFSDGTITIGYPSNEFGLATSTEQVLVKSYIPPCDESFDYCVYYTGSRYANTNFESAGLRIRKRSDLKDEAACLKTPPVGYANMIPKVDSSADYSTSLFSPLGDAGAGHYANGDLYRLSYKNTCYEFETRVGASQFLNYPAGSIHEFTADDQVAAFVMLAQILKTITLPSSLHVVFP